MISCSKCKKATLPVSDGGCIKTGGIVDIGCEYGEPRILTNADRIRAMTDTELADYFSELSCWPNARKEVCRGVANCDKCWLNWLQQEAKT